LDKPQAKTTQALKMRKALMPQQNKRAKLALSLEEPATQPSRVYEFKSDKAINFDGYIPVTKFDDEENNWIAFLEGYESISAFAGTPELALRELSVVWEDVKESYRQSGEEIPLAPPARRNYSGQFNVRVGKEIHRLLAEEADEVGISLNALINQKLAKRA
jgi:predicted HicB family RNase H-like nuclease